jgi:hypothetical protein
LFQQCSNCWSTTIWLTSWKSVSKLHFAVAGFSYFSIKKLQDEYLPVSVIRHHAKKYGNFKHSSHSQCGCGMHVIITFFHAIVFTAIQVRKVESKMGKWEMYWRIKFSVKKLSVCSFIVFANMKTIHSYNHIVRKQLVFNSKVLKYISVISKTVRSGCHFKDKYRGMFRVIFSICHAPSHCRHWQITPTA